MDSTARMKLADLWHKYGIALAPIHISHNATIYSGEKIEAIKRKSHQNKPWTTMVFLTTTAMTSTKILRDKRRQRSHWLLETRIYFIFTFKQQKLNINPTVAKTPKNYSTEWNKPKRGIPKIMVGKMLTGHQSIL